MNNTVEPAESGNEKKATSWLPLLGMAGGILAVVLAIISGGSWIGKVNTKIENYDTRMDLLNNNWVLESSKSSKIEADVRTNADLINRMQKRVDNLREDFRGDKGSRGDIGPPGPPGPQGAQGIPGIQGIAGLQGVKGDSGPQGQQGIQGIQGERGNPGINGIDGTQVIAGFWNGSSLSSLSQGAKITAYAVTAISVQIDYSSYNFTAAPVVVLGDDSLGKPQIVEISSSYVKINTHL